MHLVCWRMDVSHQPADAAAADLSTVPQVLTLQLHCLLTFTSTSTWRVLTNPAHQQLKPVMDQLCAVLLRHLSSGRLMQTLKVGETCI